MTDPFYFLSQKEKEVLGNWACQIDVIVLINATNDMKLRGKK